MGFHLVRFIDFSTETLQAVRLLVTGTRPHRAKVIVVVPGSWQMHRVQVITAERDEYNVLLTLRREETRSEAL